MALPTIIGGGQPVPTSGSAFLPPFVHNGNVYVIAPSGGVSFNCYKATDPTASFSAQDVSNRPNQDGVAGCGVFQNGSFLHLLIQRGSSVGTAFAYYSRFDCSTDQWVLFSGDADAPVLTGYATGSSTTSACSVVVRSTGEVVGAINGAYDKVMGTNYERIDMVRSTNGTTWTVEDATNNTGAEIHYTNPVCVLGASDRVHIFYKNHTSHRLLVSTLLSNNTWGSRGVVVASSIDSAAFPVGRGVNSSGTIYVPYRNAAASTSIASFTSADIPSGFSLVGAGDEVVLISSGFALHGLSLDGTDRHLAYIRNTDDDFARDVDTGSGWGTDTVERALASVTHLSSNVIDR